MPQVSIPRLVSMNEVLQITSLKSRSSIHRLTRQGRFPPPCSIGAGQIRWREDDIRAWMEALPVCDYAPRSLPEPVTANSRSKERRRG